MMTNIGVQQRQEVCGPFFFWIKPGGVLLGTHYGRHAGMHGVERGSGGSGEQATTWVRLSGCIHPVFPKRSNRQEGCLVRLNIKRPPFLPLKKNHSSG